MPWLVVLGTGSWCDPAVSRQTFRASYCKKKGTGYKVEEDIAEAARATGYWWLQVYPDEMEPELDVSDPSGPLTLEDVKTGLAPGVRLQVIEGGGEPEEEYQDPEAPPLEHACQWCPRRFPSSGALGRHVEFEHTLAHEADIAASIEHHRKRMAEKTALRRLEDYDEPLPPWEREAVEQGPTIPPEVE